ncbi:hypothetical protein PGH12_12500 [Chryseobacterium wangxinyae]|uniref:hypothetical protein n=1 Tax=Chryseobacterium sp. CY350 TaxID=2997336 RepID=UPI00226D82FB|nr:hypothetical protein [Chryseobacterium sp. CY350]MCY0976111.1 hypothetical protein [Chryseobacterium sp. CY350]WBZ94289.1 hypothetical protein PGH12_12500 [Chryseobacterium sp. CY350]
MKNFDLDKLERKNIYDVPENMFQNIQDSVLGKVNDFDLDNVERKNIYEVREDMFLNVQMKVLSSISDFDIEKLDRKNIYKISDQLFENVQQNVMKEVNASEKTPVFKLNWGYAAAASLALIFGSTFLYNSYSDSSENQDSAQSFVSNEVAPKKESELAYETLKSDLTSVEKNNQTIDNQQPSQQIKTVAFVPEKTDIKLQTVKPVSKKTEAQMNEYLESLTSSEIAELANNSSQDVYLDLYN